MNSIMLGIGTANPAAQTTDPGIFINSSNEDLFVSYKKLNKNSKFILGILQEYGLNEGDELVFQLQY